MSISILSTPSAFNASLKCASLLSAVAFILACGGAQSGSSDSSSDGYTGPITVTNETDSPICGADFFQWYPEVRLSSNRFADSPIAQGQSREFDRGGAPTEYLRLMPCSGNTVLWDSFHPSNTGLNDSVSFSRGGNVTLVASGTQVLEGGSLTLVRENTPLSAYVPTPGSLAPQHSNIMSFVSEAAQARNYSGQLVSATITSNDWEIERDDFGNIESRELDVWIGVQRPNNYCFYTYWGFAQQHQGGGSYGSNLNFAGGGAMRQVPCEVLGSGGGSAAAAPAAPAAGGNCTNTCRTSNDGECDDGGPNSLYSICGLGTDCNDCGPR